MDSVKIIADAGKAKKISDRLYGLFFEDINFSIDGGLNNNQIINPSFEMFYGDFKRDFHYYYFKIFRARRRFITRIIKREPLKYWQFTGTGEISGGIENPMNAVNVNYLRLSCGASCRLINLGYNGGDSETRRARYRRRHSGECAIGIIKDTGYDVSFYVRNIDFEGKVTVYIENDAGRLTTAAEFNVFEKQWAKAEARIKGLDASVGRFIAEFEGKGELCLDDFYFGSSDYWGADDLKWSGGRMRKDMVEALKELKPKFIRFPGGCLVEGYTLDDAYNWKNTVGEVTTRKHNLNLWGDAQRDKCYMQSYAIGFYEYFLLCEDLKAEPMPILNAGLACQGRSRHLFTKPGEDKFEELKQNILDLVEFANGDPAANKWAKLRADMGHQEPFGLRMLGIGNENFGSQYMENFKAMYAALHLSYPDIEVIWSSGWSCYKSGGYEENRAEFDKAGYDDSVIVDDHFYRNPQWLFDNAAMYDDYPLDRSPIFLGEYAANGVFDMKASPNNYLSALSEAAYLTGIERNADKVIMSSYAPLFSRAGGEQWRHNMININSLYLLKTANYYVQELYAKNIGGYYIPAEVGADNLFASITADDNIVYVKAVNVLEKEQKADFRLGLELLDGEWYSMDCQDNYARNTFGTDMKPSENIKPVRQPIECLSGGFSAVLKPRSVNVFAIKYKR